MWLLFIMTSAFGWALVNVLDSMLVRKYNEPPVILMWSQAVFSVAALAILAVFADLRTEWWPLLVAMGFIAYFADVLFFWVLAHIDVSVTNAAWPILSIFLSIAGFLMFHESWTPLQAVGSVLIVGGVLLLSFAHPTRGSLKRTLFLLLLLALIYTPAYVARKAALNAGQGVLPVFFWLLIGREALSFTFPLTQKRYRADIKRLLKKADIRFFAVGAIVITAFFFGEYTGALAMQIGQISLVSIVSNVQPFMVIGLAALFARFLPTMAARELLSLESVRTKLLCFSIVFAGLALLAVPQ